MLYLWTDDYDGTAISQDGSFANPVVFKSAPAGSTQEVQLFLRHSELSGELAESSYTITVAPADDFGTSQASWVQLAPDASGSPGTYGAAGATLTVGDILVGQIYSLWVKLTIPTGTPGAKEDIYLKVEASQTPSNKKIDLSTGIYTHCAYELDTDSIKFDTANTNGSWYSTWYDISAYTAISNVSYDVDGTNVYVEYRTSTDKSETTATSWMTTPSEIDLTKDYFQVRVRFERNGLVGTVGLIQRVYGGSTFSVFKGEYIGAQMPFTGDPGQGIAATKSVRWSGYFYAATTGTYTWRIVSNDGHNFFVDGNTHVENFNTTTGDNTLSDTVATYLTAGYHSVIFEYLHISGDDDIKTYITLPSVSERAIQLTDFIPYEPVLRINSIQLKYSGPKTAHYDTRIYIGPDVPTLVSPANGYVTKLFRPEFTAHELNSQYIEFQLDNDTTFGSVYLSDFTVAASGFDADVSGTPVEAARPPGIYYWRARGTYDGVQSNWSDWRYLTILPLVPQSEFLYLNDNVGLAIHDSIIDVRGLYLNDNVGIASHDPIIDIRAVYLNADLELGIGKVIYPFYDDTRSRKLDFEGDDDFIID